MMIQTEVTCNECGAIRRVDGYVPPDRMVMGRCIDGRCDGCAATAIAQVIST